MEKTPKQRADIYRELAKKAIESQETFFVCNEAKEAMNLRWHTKVEDYIPEYMLFKSDAVYGSAWFDYQFYGNYNVYQNNEQINQLRVLALLLSAEIALNP
jgi:hypothetical protein